MAPPEIGLVLYPGVQLAAVHGLTDLFAMADRFAAAHTGDVRPALRVSHWQPDAVTVACVYDTHPAHPSAPQIIVLPPTLTDLPERDVMARIAGWLNARHAGGATVGSVCSGAFFVAEAELLAGRAVSTHWSCAEELAARFPDTQVETERRIIDNGDVITAGGFMAWLDLGLKLVDRLLGPTIAAETARFLTVDPRTPQQHYFNGFSPRLAHGDAAILKAQHWLHGRDARDVSLAAMARQAGLEKRTFLRRFASATGMTPIQYCRTLRIARARELLEFSNRTLKEIAWAVGYADAGAFARVFQNVAGLSPGDYRRKFGNAGEPATAA